MIPARCCGRDKCWVDLQDFRSWSDVGSQYSLLVVDKSPRACSHIYICGNVQRFRVQYTQAFGVTLSTMSDAGGGVTAEAVSYLCRWQRVQQLTRGGSVNPCSSQRDKEVGGGGALCGIHGILQSLIGENGRLLCSTGLQDPAEYVGPSSFLAGDTFSNLVLTFDRDAPTTLTHVYLSR